MIQINDSLYKTLGDLGFEGALPDRIYAHLGSLGYDGALPDRLGKEGGWMLYVARYATGGETTSLIVNNWGPVNQWLGGSPSQLAAPTGNLFIDEFSFIDEDNFITG